jgi:RHS repeat-associated protein
MPVRNHARFDRLWRLRRRAGSFSERLYVQQDANWNVTAVINTSGVVQERYIYDPYGQASFLDPVSWVVRGGGPNGASQYSWDVLVTGPAGGPWAVHFTGLDAGISVATMGTDATGLTGGGVTVATTYQAADAGRVQQVTDPRGLITKTDFDLMDRTVRTVEAYDGLAPGNATDKTTEYTYDGDNHVLTVQADLPDGNLQQTQYVYGVSPSGSSFVTSNDLLGLIAYPELDTGLASTVQAHNQWEVFAYDGAGEEVVQKDDRNGTLKGYLYDVLGRPTFDAVEGFGAGVDNHVASLATAYDAVGRPYLFSSLDPSNNILNQVQRAFNGFRQVTTEWQEHNGTINGNTPFVQYAYSFNPSLGGANNSRLVSITYPVRDTAYPSGRVIDYGYNPGTGAAGIDDRISRISFVADDNSGTPVTPHLEDLSYLGLATVVKRAHPQPNVDLTYLASDGPTDGGDQYHGLDRFGRVVDQAWQITNTSTYTDRFQYGYDRDANRLYRNNLVNTSFGELYHQSGAGYGYDALNQLTAFSRGVLSASQQNGPLDTVAAPVHSQSWTLDVMGNWSQFNSDSTSQTRGANRQNEITSISGQTTPTYDNNGNTTKDNSGRQFVYDAWNRIVKVKDQNGVLLGNYAYDALGRRIQEPVDATHARDLYFSKDWQVLEERDTSGTVVRAENVWSPVYVDALVLRDRDPSGAGSFSERLYTQQDANWNVTAVINSAGAVQERYVYDPYGQASFLDPVTWAVRGGGPNGTSQYAWVYLHQGGRLDLVSRFYNFRERDYSPTLGGWMSVDPTSFSAGDMNLYRYENNSPQRWIDPLGTDIKEDDPDDELYPVVRNIRNLPTSLDVPDSLLWIGYKGAIWNVRNKWRGCNKEMGSGYTETKTDDTSEHAIYVKSGQAEWSARAEPRGPFLGIGSRYTRVYFELKQTYDVYMVKFRTYSCSKCGALTMNFNVVDQITPAGQITRTIARKYADYPGHFEIDLKEVLENAKKAKELLGK